MTNPDRVENQATLRAGWAAGDRPLSMIDIGDTVYIPPSHMYHDTARKLWLDDVYCPTEYTNPRGKLLVWRGPDGYHVETYLCGDDHKFGRRENHNPFCPPIPVISCVRIDHTKVMSEGKVVLSGAIVQEPQPEPERAVAHAVLPIGMAAIDHTIAGRSRTAPVETNRPSPGS